jgi:hypothetical protein
MGGDIMDRDDAEHTMADHAQELADIEAKLRASEEELLRLHRDREALSRRREFVATRLERQRLLDSLGGFVKLTGDADMEPKTVVRPKVGAVGRLIKIGRTRAMVDFGEDLHTWYVPLTAVTQVTDPLAPSTSREPGTIKQMLEQSLENIHQDLMRDDELTDEERWEDDMNRP